MKQYFIVLFIGLIITTSCSDDSKLYEVGEDFIESNELMFLTDTLTVETATIIADSLITSDSDRILLGALDNDKFGTLTSKAFLKLTPSVYTISEDAVFDSIALVLHYDRYYYGDTTEVQNYRIHEVTEDFETNEDEDEYYFYNTSSLSYSSETLGEISFTPYPNKKDSIYIPLSNDFGKNIFDKIQDDEIEDLNDFEKLFRGIAIVPNNISNTVLGYDYTTETTYSHSSIRMYYTINDDDDEDNDYILNFTLQSTNSTFNNITSDKSATELSSLTDSEDVLDSSETSNKIYLQSGTGVAMRVEVPYTNTLTELENDGTTLQASLKMYPVQNSYDNLDLIETLAVYVVNDKNEVLKQLTDFSGNAVYAQLNTDDSEFNNEIYYTTDVSYYIEELQTSTYTLDYALRFEFPENTNSINQLLIHDPESPENSDLKMKLSLTYLSF